MTTAELLAMHDRCPRSAFWGEKWEAPRLHPNEVLRRAVEGALLTDEDDPGQYAGDTVMTLASERELAVSGSQYTCAMHHAALADVITTVLSAQMPAAARPADKVTKTLSWTSGAFLEAGNLRLRRILMVDRWSKEREAAETHSWKCLGEMSVYEMPMTLVVVLIGQMREGRHHSPWSKGFLHPQNKNLRIRKRDGETFGSNWSQVWREEQDWLSRDLWIEKMVDDHVMHDVLFDVELEVPCPEIRAKVRKLAENKLAAMRGTKETPPPSISVCDFPTPCRFVDACWNFTEPSERTGFIPVTSLS